MSPHELREQILTLYRQIDENAKGDVDKSLRASREALSVFRRETGFAEGHLDLVHDGYQKIYAVYKYCDSRAAGELVSEWTMFVVRGRTRSR
jgi:hypothetical protein